jgi:tetratricopeptide (TPR) repeat protein
MFADVGPSIALADWLNQRLVKPPATLQQQEVPASVLREPDAHAEALVADLPRFAAQPGAIWLQLNRHPSDEQWNRARRVFLARLNERRFLLEHHLPRPLILLFPVAFKGEARTIAPDLWSVRSLSDELRAKPGGAMTVDVEMATGPVGATANLPSDPSLAYTEWLRLMAGPSERANLATARQAINDLLASGRPSDAEVVANQARDLAAVRARTQPEDPAPLRDLSVLLDDVGRVAEAQGNWSEAETVYRESLAIRRQLLERLGGSPEALRDVSVSLDNVGRVAEAQGNWSEAETVYRESLAIRRQLLERLGGSPEALRDVSVSLDNVGRVAQAQGGWSEAETVYRESLAIRRQLLERLGGSPEALRDVSVSLNNVGRVAEAQGNWSEAETVYRESLAISRQLLERLGGSPQALDDLGYSLSYLGSLPNRGDVGLLKEALSIYQGLVTSCPAVPNYRQRLDEISRLLGTTELSGNSHSDS